MDENQIIPSASPDKNNPEKYIRTFAGDIETIQAGGVPDLAPLQEEVHPVPAERLVAASPLPPTPIPTPAPIKNPASESASTYTPPPPLETPLKTYADDFSERMKETNASTATVLAAEQDRAPETPPQEAETSSRANLFYIIGGVILLIAGGVGAYITYTAFLTATAPITPSLSIAAPIFVDEREQISGAGATLLKAIEASVAQSLAPNTVRLLFVSTTTTTGSIFSALPLSVPDILLRNVNTDGSMAGVIHMGSSNSPFFILSVSSYSNTFSGMLSWEKTMPRNFATLFPAYPSAIVPTVSTSSPQVTVATTTVSNKQSGFRDEVVGNHDVRIYRDEAGRSIMLYGYWNQTTLVIARDPATFGEILGRLANSRSK